MNNKRVKYLGNFPNGIKQSLSDAFCMGWQEVKESQEITVKFVSDKPFEGFTLDINGLDYYFDFNSESYMKINA